MNDAIQSSGVVNIGDRRELFVDHHLIDRMVGTRLVMHRPVEKGAALKFDRPWEGRYSAFVTVFQDGDVYRCYYRGTPVDYDVFAGICYAESKDGVNWEKPNLGLCEFEGSRENNILMTSGPTHAFAPFIDTRPGVSADEKYKAIGVIGSDKLKVAGMGTTVLGAYGSPDGIHWRKLQEQPVMTKGGFDSLNVAFWSETEGCYVSYFRVWSKALEWSNFMGKRSIGRATSQDFLNWSDPVMMDFGDRRTEELYTNATLPYYRAPHIYVSQANRFLLGRKAPLTVDQRKPFEKPDTQCFISEGVLMTSRGGNRYDRTFMEAFIRPGTDPQNWCSRNVMPAWGILQTSPTEMSLYYSQHYAQATSYLGRATLRIDGFASVQAPFEGGEMVTKPLVFKGKQLELNMATSGSGFIRVEVQDEHGKPFKDFGWEDCGEFYCDKISQTIKWQGSPWLTALEGKVVRLRFVMKDADLYSMKFG
jgi:hypothetical protein